MVLGHLTDRARYEGLHPLFKAAFDFIERCEAEPLAQGEYEIDARDLYAMVQQYDTMPDNVPGWEGHRKYVDIQYVRSGEEAHLYAPIEQIREGAVYHGENDLLRCDVKDSMRLSVRQGQFAIYFPEDLHKPKCMLNGPCRVDKIVVKVALTAARNG